MDGDEETSPQTESKFFTLGCLTGAAALFIIQTLIFIAYFVYTRRNGRANKNKVSSESEIDEKKAE